MPISQTDGYFEKPGRNYTNADALSHFPEDIKEYNKTYTNEVFSVVTDGIKTQECCNEPWLCAVNTSSDLKNLCSFCWL